MNDNPPPERRVTRRQFLVASAAASGGILAGSLVLQGKDAWWLAPAKWGYRELAAAPELPDTPTGPLDDKTTKGLLEVTRTLLGTKIEDEHYLDYFAWHAENLPGYQTVYVEFTSMLDEASDRRCGRPFSDCNDSEQRSIIEDEIRRDIPSDRVGKLRNAILGSHERTLQVISRYVLVEIVGLFIATDMWVQTGYDTWPGTPRGLDDYTQPQNHPA